MDLTLTQVIDETFGLFGKIQNTASFGKRAIGLDWGKFMVNIDTLFLPTVSGNEGYMISKVTPSQQVKLGQPELSLAYTHISGLENVKDTQSVSTLFNTHMIPPGKEKVGILKVYGTLMHYGFPNFQKEITEHQVKKAKYNIDAPLEVIVFSGMNLDPKFNKLTVLQEAKYDSEAPMSCVTSILADLNIMPNYAIPR